MLRLSKVEPLQDRSLRVRRVLRHPLRIHAVLREALPKSQRLIRSRGNHRRSVRRLRHVQHSRRVASKLGNLRHRRVLPQAQLILRIPVARQQLSLVRVPLQRAHLRVRVDRVRHRPGIRVPKLYASIRGPAPRR